MNTTRMICAVIWLVAFSGIGLARQDKSLDGKTIFTAKKCSGCHSIEAAGIVKATASTAKQGPPDLSRVGSMVDSGFIARFIMKEDTLHGKKHLIKFNGSDEERKTLCQWLESLKAPADSTKK